MPSDTLFLHEELMLLALKDDKGTVVSGTMYAHAMGGAVLAELLMAERVAIRNEKRRSYVDVVRRTQMNDPLLDEWLREMATAKRPGQVVHWVGKIAGTRSLRHRVARQLARRGVLRVSEDRVLLVFSRTVYPEVDPAPEQEILGRLETAIFEDGDVDPRTAILAALAHHSGLLKIAFDRKRLRSRKARLKAIAEGSVAAKATAEAIEAVQAAIATAAVVSTVVINT